MDKNKFNKIKIELAKDLSARLNISGAKGFNRDLKTVLDCINLTPEGAILVDYGTIEGQGLDYEKIQPFIEKFFKKSGLKNPTTEGEVIGQTKNRWVATVEMYVYGSNEKEAIREANDLIQMIDEQADNGPRLVDLVPQQFGKIGMGEANIPGEAGYISDENKVDEMVTEMIELYKELRDSVENLEDYLAITNDKSSPANVLKLIKNPKLKNVIIKYMQLDKKLNNLSPETQMAIGTQLAQRYYEIM